MPLSEHQLRVLELIRQLDSASPPVDTMVRMARGLTRNWTADEFFADLEPPSADDHSITADGRVLDTPDKVRAFLAEINAQREASPSNG